MRELVVKVARGGAVARRLPLCCWLTSFGGGDDGLGNRSREFGEEVHAQRAAGSQCGRRGRARPAVAVWPTAAADLVRGGRRRELAGGAGRGLRPARPER